MKNLLVFLVFLLPLGNVWAQIKVEKHVLSDLDSSVLYVASFNWSDTISGYMYPVYNHKLLDFYELENQISSKVFTQDELACISKQKPIPRLFIAITGEGKVLGMRMFIPEECISIFTEEKIKKYWDLWLQVNWSEYLWYTHLGDVFVKPKDRRGEIAVRVVRDSQSIERWRKKKREMDSLYYKKHNRIDSR